MTCAALADSVGEGLVPASLRVGLIGHGIGQSRTPGMHMSEGTALGLPYVYDLIDTGELSAPDLGALLDRAEADGFAGVNVTHPYKQEAVLHVHDLSPAAAAIGAINTIVFADGRRTGHNTDSWGFVQAARLHLPGAAMAHVLLLGAGGAGRAVGHALVELGAAQISIIDTSDAAAQALAADINAASNTDIASAVAIPDNLRGVDGVVNATPVGMNSHPGTPMATDLLTTRQWVADIIYFPIETDFLKAARRLGCRTMDGSGMAVFQAVRAFELFTGQTPDPIRMRATFDALGRDTQPGRTPNA